MVVHIAKEIALYYHTTPYKDTYKDIEKKRDTRLSSEINHIHIQK